MMTEKYQDWQSLETWAAAEGLGAERRSAMHVREIVQKSKAGAAALGCEQQWLMADWLKEWIERDAPEVMPNLYSELLQAALARVDWYEVARYILDTGEDGASRFQPEQSDRAA
jgi:hypothetical protein